MSMFFKNHSLFRHFWSIKILMHETKLVTFTLTLKEQITSLFLRKQEYENQAESILKTFWRFWTTKITTKRAKSTLFQFDSPDNDFPAIKSNYDRRAHAHHMVTGHKTPHNSVPEYVTGRIQSQVNQLPQQFTQPQNMISHFLPDNTLPIVEQTPQRQKSDASNSINRLAEGIVGNASQK